MTAALSSEPIDRTDRAGEGRVVWRDRETDRLRWSVRKPLRQLAGDAARVAAARGVTTWVEHDDDPTGTGEPVDPDRKPARPVVYLARSFPGRGGDRGWLEDVSPNGDPRSRKRSVFAPSIPLGAMCNGWRRTPFYKDPGVGTMIGARRYVSELYVRELNHLHPTTWRAMLVAATFSPIVLACSCGGGLRDRIGDSGVICLREVLALELAAHGARVGGWHGE